MHKCIKAKEHKWSAMHPHKGSTMQPHKGSTMRPHTRKTFLPRKRGIWPRWREREENPARRKRKFREENKWTNPEEDKKEFIDGLIY